MAAEKRRLAVNEVKTNREVPPDPLRTEDASVLDNLLEKLRNGDIVGRRQRRTRPSVDRNEAPLPLSFDGSVDIARDMLAQLKSDGFETSHPLTSPAIPARRRRPRPDKGSVDFDDWQAAEDDIRDSEAMDEEELESDGN